MHDKKWQEHNRAWGKITAKAWRDELFKQRLLNNPKDVLREYGIQLPDGQNVKIHQNTKDTKHLVVLEAPSGTLSEEELHKIAGGDGCTF